MKNFTFIKDLFNGKVALTAILATIGMTASAQSLKTLNTMTAEDGTEFLPVSQAISSNHRYATGPAYNMMTGGFGMFVYDLETDQYALEPEVDYFGADMRAVTDDGVAIGYNGPALTFSINGEINNLPVPEGFTAIARDASDDMSVIVGCYYEGEGMNTMACIWRDGEIEKLPEPTSEELGFETNGTSAFYTNADGSVIVGYVVDNFSTRPMIIWRLQSDGSYTCDPICARYFTTDGSTPDRPYIEFSPSGISRNGRYISLNVAQEGTEERMARYDLTTGELQEFIADGSNGINAGTGTYAAAVADDGTLCGWMLEGNWVMQTRHACVWRTGDAAPVILADEYPEISELATYDMVGFNTLCDITPDGRYITGFAMDESYLYTSFVLDLNDTATGISKTVAGAEDSEETARYGIDGTRLNAPVKGLNIVKKADGTTVKVLVK